MSNGATRKDYGAISIALSSIIFIILILVLLSGAESPEQPTSAETLASTECPPATPFSQDERVSRRTLYYLLVENSQPYQQGGNIQLARQVLTEVMSEKLLSGDRVIASWIDGDVADQDFADVVAFDKTYRAQETNVTVAPLVTPTRAVRPTPERTPFSQVGQTREANMNFRFEATNTHAMQVFNCQVFLLNQEQAAERERNRSELTTILSEFMNDLNHALTLATPAPNADGQVPIMESLVRSTDFMDEECVSGGFSNCILLIFSNMRDQRATYVTAIAENLATPALSRIDVIYVLFDCKYARDECFTRIQNWDRHFSAFHTASLQYVLNSVDDPLLNQLNTAIESTFDE